MNNLSWLIYLSNVLPSLSTFLAFTVVIAGIAFIIFSLIAIFSKMDYDEEDGNERGSARRAHIMAKPLAKLACAYLLIVGIITSMIPSQKTILLIAASQVGEQVIKSKQFTDTLDPSMEFLQEWIKKQTADLTAPKK